MDAFPIWSLQVGMRMGHGIKDESEATRIYFVTTGYLVRLLAHHPESFQAHTHLIIDEVHERSVDGDILCLLARRLLQVRVLRIGERRGGGDEMAALTHCTER